MIDPIFAFIGGVLLIIALSLIRQWVQEKLLDKDTYPWEVMMIDDKIKFIDSTGTERTGKVYSFQKGRGRGKIVVKVKARGSTHYLDISKDEWRLVE